MKNYNGPDYTRDTVLFHTSLLHLNPEEGSGQNERAKPFLIGFKSLLQRPGCAGEEKTEQGSGEDTEVFGWATYRMRLSGHWETLRGSDEAQGIIGCLYPTHPSLTSRILAGQLHW